MNVEVKTAEIEVRTARLTKSLLKQLPEISYQEYMTLSKDNNILGWVHGSVLNKDEDHKTWLILRRADATWARYETMNNMRKVHQQIFVI